MNTSRQQLLTTRALAILVCVSACDEGSDPAPDEATNTLAASDLALGDDAAPDALDSAGMDVADLQDQFAFDADPGFVQDLYGDPVPSNITTPVPELAGAGEIDLALTDVVEPYYPSARELDHILELRLNYGLSANAEFVRELHAEPRRHGAIRSRVSLFGGLLLAPNELPACSPVPRGGQ